MLSEKKERFYGLQNAFEELTGKHDLKAKEELDLRVSFLTARMTARTRLPASRSRRSSTNPLISSSIEHSGASPSHPCALIGTLDCIAAEESVARMPEYNDNDSDSSDDASSDGFSLSPSHTTSDDDERKPAANKNTITTATHKFL